jgi:dTDP-4-amino-4,6-dideoxygalactose transaminase
MQVRFGDLALEYKSLKGEIDHALQQVLNRGWFVLGEEGQAFEQAFAAYCGTAYAAGVASGTEAIYLALLAHGIGPGDEVVTVPNTAVPTANAISMAGARPVFVDVRRDTYLMDPGLLDRAITGRTRAILPVHLYGQCAEMDAINAVAQAHGIPVIEDCAQAHGATYQGRKAGTLAQLSCFSFYPSKNLGCYGDGGAVVTGNHDLYQSLTKLRNYGQSERYHHDVVGINSRLDELQAAILSVKLAYLDHWNRRRREIAALYDQLLDGSRCVKPYAAPGCEHIYHLYVIQVRNRDGLRMHLQENGIQVLVHYPIPIHLQPAYHDLGHRPGDFPVAERLATRILSLPLHPFLKNEEVCYVVEAVNTYLEHAES